MSPLVAILLVALATTATGLSLVSVQDEIAAGREVQRQMRRKTPIVRDPALSGYVNGIGRRLVAVAGGPRYPYTFDIADSRDVNAFALPGGPIWINRGAIEAAGSEAQLAAVLAHEVAHVARRHAAAQMTTAMVAQWSLGFMSALLGNTGGAVTSRLVATSIANGTFRRYTRDDEREADRVGAEIMHRAGWDARGMLEMMETVGRVAKRRPGAVEQMLSTHPQADERARLLAVATSRLRGGVRDTERFREMRRRARRLPR